MTPKYGHWRSCSCFDRLIAYSWWQKSRRRRDSLVMEVSWTSAWARLQRSTWLRRCLGRAKRALGRVFILWLVQSQFLKDVLHEITTFGVAGGLQTILKSLYGYADMVWRLFLSVGRELERTLEATGSPTGSPSGMCTSPPPGRSQGPP